MRRNLEHVKHLLDLIQAHATEYGINMLDLQPKWEATSGKQDILLRESELIYLLNRCEEAGFISISGGNTIQLTWAGHDYLDSVTAKPVI
jgi:hypothetical protein